MFTLQSIQYIYDNKSAKMFELFHHFMNQLIYVYSAV